MGDNVSLLKILLVDDEPIIRKGLAALIDWEAEGYSIVGEAANGKSAIQLLKGNAYDVIICDIKMPEMDGIEFITYVKDNKISKARFVFLSGFYDFKYAKTAIKYSCCGYILKPVQKEEILSTMRRIADEYQKEMGNEKNIRDYEKAYLDQNLRAIIWGKYDSINIKSVMEKMQFSDEICYIHIEISLKDERFFTLLEDKKREKQRKLFHYATILLKKQADHIIFDVARQAECYDIGIVFCTYMAQDKNISKEEWLNWLIKELTERMDYKIVACAGSNVNEISAITYSYREAIMERFFRFYQKHDNKGNVKLNKSESHAKFKQKDYFKKELDNFVYAIEVSDKLKIREGVKFIYSRMLDRHIDSEVILLNIQYLLYRLLGLAYEQEANINQDEIMQYIWEAIFSSDKVQGNELKFLQFAEEYSNYIRQLRQNTVKGSINKIETYIGENYAENISLKSLGEKYYVNSVYLGQVFKKQCGCAFKDYLNNLRIRKAAELILRTDKKVYEIAGEVGYKNLEYFINKFESIYGVTPTRFRKRNLSR